MKSVETPFEPHELVRIWKALEAQDRSKAINIPPEDVPKTLHEVQRLVHMAITNTADQKELAFQTARAEKAASVYTLLEAAEKEIERLKQQLRGK